MTRLATLAAWNVILAGMILPGPAEAAAPSSRDLVIAARGQVQAIIVVSPQAGKLEQKAADDLARYIGLICGSTPQVARTPQAVKAALADKRPVLVVGQQALTLNPSLGDRLKTVLKPSPRLASDGIVLLRQGRHVFLAGNNPRAHYFAVAEFLRGWGCRWYLPTEFGECIPRRADLHVGELDRTTSSPFEVRTYWISWLGDRSGADDFRLQNMMTDRSAMPPTGHALGKFTRGLGKGTFHFPITAPNTAKHVAAQVEKQFAAGGRFSLGMEDGSYNSDDPRDQRLMKLQWDKYFMRWSVTDPMLELYNNVAGILQRKYPRSQARIGFLAYANMTIPPTRKMIAEKSLYCELAPIDIDPIHGIDDRQSPPRREFGNMMFKWARIMQGRLCIYDYDQGMLVWRDIPNPSHQAFRQDVKHYRRAGILGVNTESRNAIATTFLNLHIRARLLWNPDEDVEALLAEFYPAFYGPAAEPMAAYWSAIYEAWNKSICTEHEYFVAPAIYTPELVKQLGHKLQDARRLVADLKTPGRKLDRNERLYLRRLEFTELSYLILEAYTSMVKSAATDADYDAAVAAGERGLKARKEMAKLGGIFTSTRLENDGYPWWPGEVKQYRELLPLTDGRQGQLVTRLPLTWALHRDTAGKGVERGFATGPVDLAYWKKHRSELSLDGLKDYPDQWEQVRTDLYAQAQGIRHPDRQSYTGHLWYRTDVTLTADQSAGNLHVRFPGLFNECWLFINGREVAQRKQGKVWWKNDYRFEWDVDLTGQLRPGVNSITVRCHCEHHFGGMFRRPFLYEVTGK